MVGLCKHPHAASLKEGINRGMCMWEMDQMCVVADSFAPHHLFLWEMQCGNYSCDKREQMTLPFAALLLLHKLPPQSIK